MPGVTHLVGKVVALLVLCALVSTVASAQADPPTVACAHLDKYADSLNNEVRPALSGLVQEFSGPAYNSWTMQTDAEAGANSIIHGAEYMQGLDAEQPVPGMAPLLTNLERQALDLNADIQLLFPWRRTYIGFGSGPVFNGAQSSTWNAINDLTQTLNSLVTVVNTRRGNCT